MADLLQIDQMTLAEKLRAMEALWANLCRQESDIAVPQWHQELLGERERLLAEGQATFMDWDTAKQRIAAKTT